MHLADGIKSSLQTISNHKFRSFLTLLGIIIGVTSVVTMFSSVSAIKNIMHDNMSKMGFDNVLYISAKTSNRTVRRRGFVMVEQGAARRSQPITYKDFEALKRELDVKRIYGWIESWHRTIDNKWIRLRATNEDYFHTNTYPLKEGRFFNDFEMKNAEKVCIVGPNFSKEHFKGEHPIGNYFTVGKNRFKIIGILDVDQLNQGFGGFNPWGRSWDLDSIYIPLHTGAVYLRQGLVLDRIDMQAHNLESFEYMKDRANQVMLAQHKMEKDFEFNDINSQLMEITQQLDKFLNTWTIALVAIASISLFVGGIGLFSTLLISINERMLEIGIRKSIGATDFDIFFYFILEALTLSFIAGFIGIGIGLTLTHGLGMLIKQTVPLEMVSIYVGLIFALGIGFLSGLYPAIKASGINPIQAIYYFE